MKIILYSFLFLTTTISFAQDTTLAPLSALPEEMAPVSDVPVLEEAIPAPVVEETASVVDEPIQVNEPRKKDTVMGVRGLVDSETAAASTPPVAQSYEEVDSGDRFDHRRSNWVGLFGFENTKYEIPFDFTGTKETFGKEERELWGGRLGFGRDFYLGAGFIFGARLEGYYLGTLFTNAKTADNEIDDIDVAAEKDAGHIYGADAIAHLGWMFDFQTKNPFLGDMTYLALELFVEAGVGKGKSYQKKSYFFDAAPATDERYTMIMEDEYTSGIAAVGMNILSTTTGAFLYLKASQVAQNIDERKIRGRSQPDGQASVDLSEQDYDKSPSPDPITIFSLGGGLRF